MQLVGEVMGDFRADRAHRGHGIPVHQITRGSIMKTANASAAIPFQVRNSNQISSVVITRTPNDSAIINTSAS